MLEEKVSIPRFNGSEEAFKTWWIKFYFYTQGWDFVEAVNDQPETMLPATQDMPLDKNNPAEKRSKEARDQNKMACTALMLAMPDNLIVPANVASKGDLYWSQGKACLLVKFLLDKYCQAGAMTMFKAKTQINQITMGKQDNPTVVINKLERIMHWYAGVPFAGVNKTMLVAHLIKIAPEIYSQTIAKNAADAQALGCQTTLASLKTDMSSVYAVMSKGKWEKQQLLEIQHGLATREEGSKGKSMEKAIKEAVEDAMKDWKAANKQAGVERGGNQQGSGDMKLVTQPVGATITPELLAMLL